MANLVGVVGPSGSGKTRSLKNLDPDTTYIAKILNKPLPFRGGEAMFVKEKKNTGHVKNYELMLKVLKGVNEDKTYINTIIFDDVGHLMVKEAFARSGEKGFDKYMDIGRHMYDMLMYAQELREDLTVVFIFHEDLETSKIKTIGNVLDKWFDPREAFTTCLYTAIKEQEDGSFTHHFVTNKSTVDGKQYKYAKSPEEMFENVIIENDMDLVIKTINEYNNTTK